VIVRVIRAQPAASGGSSGGLLAGFRWVWHFCCAALLKFGLKQVFSLLPFADLGSSVAVLMGTTPKRTAAQRFRLTPPIVLEHPLQAQIAHLLKIEIGPPGKVAHIARGGVVWFSIDHANYAGEVPGVRVGRGIISGVPDTFILHRGRTHFIEIKTPEGEFTDHQREVAMAIVAAGGSVGAATCAEHVLLCLDEWKIPRHRRTSL
jgi:hypothetical protein